MDWVGFRTVFTDGTRGCEVQFIYDVRRNPFNDFQFLYEWWLYIVSSFTNTHIYC